jgi:hypothetical protein
MKSEVTEMPHDDREEVEGTERRVMGRSANMSIKTTTRSRQVVNGRHKCHDRECEKVRSLRGNREELKCTKRGL